MTAVLRRLAPFTSGRVGIALALALLVTAAPAVAATDPASDAIAAFGTSPVYVSPAAATLGGAVDTSGLRLPEDTYIAVLTEDAGRAGQLASEIQARVSDGPRDGVVGVVIVSSSGIGDFSAAGSGAYCKGGADLAARRAREAQSALGNRMVTALLQRFATELTELPPDEGESSCAAAEARRASSDSWTPWLWLLLAAAVGGAGIGAFAYYSRRAVRARGVVEDPVSDELPGWLAQEDEHKEQEQNQDQHDEPEKQDQQTGDNRESTDDQR